MKTLVIRIDGANEVTVGKEGEEPIYIREMIAVIAKLTEIANNANSKEANQ